MKESLLDYLQALMISGIVSENREPEILTKINEAKENIQKYGAEKIEILIGSANIPKEEWLQDPDGEMGKIVGVKEWELLADEYDSVTKWFDLGLLFFQISIVLGAVCIIIYDNPKLEKGFIALMILFGLMGLVLSTYGYALAP